MPTPTNLLAGSDGTNATIYTTALVTPRSRWLNLFTVYLRRSGATPSTGTTVSGCGLTWVKVDEVANSTGTSADRLIIFRGLGSSPTAGVLTITAPEQQIRAGWSLDAFNTIDTTGSNGANAIVQTASDQNGGTTGTGATVSLAAFSNINNFVFGAIGTEPTGVITPGSGFTELSQQTVETLSRLQTQWKNSNDTSVDWSWASVSETYVALAVEIKYKSEFSGAMI